MKPDPAEQFEALRKRYAAQIGERVVAIHAAWNQLVQSDWDKTAGVDLRQLAHKLAGSAAMFGFANLGAVARDIDLRLKEWLEHNQPLDTLARQHLAQQIALLQHAVGKYRDSTAVPETNQLTPSTAPSAPPLVTTANTESAPPIPQPQPLATPREPNGRSQTIVLVEDDREFATKLVGQLRLFNYDVHLVNDLEGLPTLIRAINPAAIIMDIVFPEGDLAGTETIANLQRERTEPIPVIYISQRDDFTARLAAVRSGGHAYFAKPVDAGQLINALG